MDIKGKVAIVTGASRGMGKQMALRLAKHGANLVLAARTVEQGQSEFPGSLKQTEQEIRALGVQCTPVKCDLTQRRDVENLCKTALDKHGRVDILVNNARYVGPGHYDPFLKLDIDTWEKNVNTNLMAPIIASRMCIPSMIHNKTGMIICTTSSAATAKFGLPGQGGMAMHYPITKLALNRFVQLLGQEMEEYKIPVIALDPGGVLTERIEMEVKAGGGAAAAGFDPAVFKSMNIPASTLEYLCCTCPDPMQYTGKVVVSQEMVDKFHLV
jgi:NAD(P)-dependent dehydrogenase (short-subunit alcohol dehydrogenase family)